MAKCSKVKGKAVKYAEGCLSAEKGVRVQEIMAKYSKVWQNTAKCKKMEGKREFRQNSAKGGERWQRTAKGGKIWLKLAKWFKSKNRKL